jgi:hypothetical protein
LIGLSLPRALNLVYVLSILGSGLGAYLLARDVFGAYAGVLAAVAYAYAPYQLLDALVRGNAPEAVALGLLPFVLWAMRRLALRGGRWRFLGAVAFLSALYLDHNISSLLFTPFLLAYLLMLWFVYKGRGHWKQVAAALGLALGLTGFFWLPALAEREYVQLYLTGATRNNDFHHNFLSLPEVFAPPEAFDTSLMNPLLDVRLGLPQVLLASAGLVVGLILVLKRRRHPVSPGRLEAGEGVVKQRLVRRESEQVWSLLFFAGVAGLFVFMSTPSSIWIWEHVPLLPFVQFPWRFVGRASLPVALLAGAAALPLRGSATEGGRGVTGTGSYVARLVLPVLVGGVVLAGLPSTYPPRGYCPMKAHPTVCDVHEYERESGLVGVDPVGAYFPVWVEQRPQGSPLEDEYAGRKVVSRFDTTVLPEGAQVLEADYDPNRARIDVESPSSFRARYQSFFFPGWRVRVDGQKVEVAPSEPEGLMTFDVPAGRHTVRVRFAETPLRMVSDGISVLSLFGLAALVFMTGTGRVSTSAVMPPSDLQTVTWVGLVVAAAVLPLFKLVVVDRIQTPFRHPDLEDNRTLPGIEHPVDKSYADGLTLIGYDQWTGRQSGKLPADQALRVDLYWTVCHPPSHRYQTVVHLKGPDGLRWSPKDSFRPTDYQGAPPTTAWEPGRYAIDSHEVEPLPGTPSGEYDVVLTVFDRDTLSPLSVLNEDGQPAAPDFVLGQVTLTPPSHQPEVGALDMQHRLDERLGAVTLLGANVSRDEAVPGDPILITTFWRAEEQPRTAVTLHIKLLDHDDSIAAAYTLPPVASWHPATAWRSGDVFRGQHLLHLPAGLSTDRYAWSLSLSSSRAVSLSRLSVTAPQRTFTLPPVTIETSTRLGDMATLVGADVTPETLSVKRGADLEVLLVWRAESETHTSYRVFLHLIDPEGNLVAQSDGIPDDWTRPTTGWVPGEVITDPRSLTVPEGAQPGDYRLVAGLYDPAGERLTDSDGDSAVPVAPVTVEAP